MSVRTLLDRFLDPGGMSLRLQPLVELAGDSIVAVECLMRGPDGTNIEPAGVLFHYVRRKRQEIRVDRACIETALRDVSRLASLRDSDLRIHLNVHASTLERDEQFLARLRRVAERNQLSLERLTLEITEHEPMGEVDTLGRVIGELKEHGVEIAVDDLGVGVSTFKTLLACRPDYLKVDRFLIDGAHRSPERLAVLESLVLLARRLGARVVAEGVEQVADLDALRGLGVDLAQGFLLYPLLDSAQWPPPGIDLADRHRQRVEPSPALIPT